MAPPRGHFILRSSVLPPVTAGDYELVSEQTGTPFDVDTSRTNITVSSPRYTMPPDQILSSFPPANAEGAFGDRLPQIVLKRRTLPWERNPFGAVEVTSTPWLALVVVAEGEAELSREPRPVAECVTPGTVLRDPQDRDVEQGYCLSVTETVVAKIFPCQEDLALLTHVREVDVGDTELANGDDDGFLAVVLANRLPVFDAATGTPVRYQACLVNLEGQLDELPPPSPPEPDFRFELAQDWSILATVTEDPDVWVSGGAIGIELADVGLELDAGAAAAAGSTSYSAARPYGGAALDGASAIGTETAASTWSMQATTNATAAVAAAAADPNAASLVRDTMKLGFHYPISIYAVERVLRFPVLAHWSFTTNEGATFETLMQDLDVGLLGTLPTPPVPEPGQPEPPPVPQQSTVIATGHLSLDHRTRRGDTSQAWYRGPCVPHPADRELPVDGELSVAHSADHLRRVVPDGLEDLSYSAAFEIGRLLALSQLSVTAALLRFRRRAVRRRPPAPDRRRRAAVDDRRRRGARPPPSRVDVLRRPDLAATGGLCRADAADRRSRPSDRGPRRSHRAQARPLRRRRHGHRSRRPHEGQRRRRRGRGTRRDRGASRPAGHGRRGDVRRAPRRLVERGAPPRRDGDARAAGEIGTTRRRTGGRHSRHRIHRSHRSHLSHPPRRNARRTRSTNCCPTRGRRGRPMKSLDAGAVGGTPGTALDELLSRLEDEEADR